MAWVLAISGVLNLALVLAWMDAREGLRYYTRRFKVMEASRDYWQLRALGKERFTSFKKGA